jgi:hypothetical protein
MAMPVFDRDNAPLREAKILDTTRPSGGVLPNRNALEWHLRPSRPDTQEVSMPESRRQVLMTLASAAGALAANPLLLSAQAVQTAPRPFPSPNTRNPNGPQTIGDPEPTVGPDHRLIEKQNQAEIRSEVQKLYELVSELKEQIEKTDATSTLSLSVVKKAQQIEKLAKQIKDRAKS